MKKYAFPKSHHLCSRKAIEALYRSGSKSQSVYPMRAVAKWTEVEEGPRVKVLMSVSKRFFKHAVDRNRVKRQMREAYRLHQEILWERVPEGKTLHVSLMWIGHKVVESELVEKRMVQLLEHVLTKLEIKTEEGL